MSFDTIIASPRSDFSKIVAITDSFVPACNTWVRFPCPFYFLLFSQTWLFSIVCDTILMIVLYWLIRIVWCGVCVSAECLFFFFFHVLCVVRQIGDYPYLNRRNFLLFLSRLRKLPRVDVSSLEISEEENGYVDVYEDNGYSGQPDSTVFPTTRKSQDSVTVREGARNNVRWRSRRHCPFFYYLKLSFHNEPPNYYLRILLFIHR